MAKNWKSFVKKENSSDQNPQSGQDALKIKQELNLSISELAKSNKDLKAILLERDELEEKMRDVLHHGPKQEQEDPRFASEVVSINQKRKEDKKRFDLKQKLETKIKQKNKELALWTKKRDQLKEKVNKIKIQFDTKKKRVTDFRNKIKSKISDDYDYDKIGNRAKKKKDDFPFLERIYKKKEEVFKKPIKRIKEKIKEKPVLKKVVDRWDLVQDKKREAQKIKNLFERKIEKKNQLFQISKMIDDDDDVKEAVIEKIIEKKNALKKQEEKLEERKKSILDTLKNKRRKKKKEERKSSTISQNEIKASEKKEEDEKERKEIAKREQLKQKKAKERKLEKEKETRREQRREERKRKSKDKFYY